MLQICLFYTTIATLLLAALHIYWGHGGNWPGVDRQNLVDKVFGQGTKFPSLLACYSVAVALIMAGLIPYFTFRNQLPSALNYGPAFIFYLRGLGGYLPFFEKKWCKIFIDLNRKIYGPLCLTLAFAFTLLA